MSNAERSTSNDSQFWEGRYLEGDTPWDKGEAAPPLMEYLSQHQVTGSVCVPGCGLGYDVRVLAGQGAEVTGMDIAPSALKQAESFPKVNAEQYHQMDWFNLPAEFESRYDWIFEHTCFCAIDPVRRVEYVEACVKTLKPGGHLLAIFFMTPDTEEGPPFGTELAELDCLFSPYFTIMDDYLPQQAYPGREGRERIRVYKKVK